MTDNPNEYSASLKHAGGTMKFTLAPPGEGYHMRVQVIHNGRIENVHTDVPTFLQFTSDLSAVAARRGEEAMPKAVNPKARKRFMDWLTGGR